MKMRILLPILLALVAVPSAGQSGLSVPGGWVGGFDADSIEVVQNQPLSFGGIAAGVTGGAVTVTWNGLRTATGVVPFGAAGYGPSTFLVTITGNGSPHYRINLPAAATLTGPGGATMTVDTFQMDPSAGRVDARTKTQVMNVGATLRVAPLQTPGTYSGVYPVTVHLGN